MPNLRIILRQLWNARLFTAINVAGLAVGIMCVLLAVLYTKDENSYDRFHLNNPHLYRITTTLIENKGEKRFTSGGTGQVQGPAFKAAVPEIKEYVRTMGGGIYGTVRGNDKTLKLSLLFADASFFNVFTFSAIEGNLQNALTNINSVVLTEKTARKFFNTTDVVGKMLEMDGDPSADKLKKPLVVTAVIKDPPRHSSLQFDILFPFEFMQLSFTDDNWLNAYLGTFIVLRPDAKPERVIEKFNAVYTVHAKEQLATNKKSYGFDPSVSYGIQPMTAIHLHPLYRKAGTNIETGVVNGSTPLYSWLFTGIAFFILLMACINFINISIANSLRRAREVGVRKVTGGSNLQIIGQFLLESSIVCLIAFVIGLLLTDLSLPVFNQIADKQITLQLADPVVVLLFIGIFCIVVLLSGCYPAITLAKFKATEVLYGRQQLGGRNLFGKGLVVVQFSLAVFLLIASFIYYRQMEYVRTKDLGYNPQNILRTYISGNHDIRPITQFLKTELAQEPSIKYVSFGSGGDINIEADAKVGDQVLSTAHAVVDENFLPVMGIPLKAGRNFSLNFPADQSKSIIVNEAFIRAAKLDNPLGTVVQTSDYFDKEPKTIIGVVKDYHYSTLKQRIQPMALLMNESLSGGILVKYDRAAEKKAVAAVERTMKAAVPSGLFEYYFVDQLAGEYTQEKRWLQIVSVATVISLIICCMGLFGLASLAVSRRTREIGIRKILGAGVARITTLVCSDFVKLVSIAILIAIPLAAVVMQTWLENFAYRIFVHWWIYLAAGAAALGIAIFTVSVQVIRTAMSNPVRHLRTE